VDSKYCSQGNIFRINRNNSSTFWKGVLLAAQAVKMGYRCVPGDGKQIRF
jgi:hypothetical protein